jgi:hypothetical protein
MVEYTVKPRQVSALPYTVLKMDVVGPGAGDGFLSLGELNRHVERLERDLVSEDPSLVPFARIELEEAQRLRRDLSDVADYAPPGAEVQIQYLPDELARASPEIRRRASEVLLQDDETHSGIITKAVIDHARGRYDVLSDVGAYAGARSRRVALDELAEIGRLLRLE